MFDLRIDGSRAANTLETRKHATIHILCASFACCVAGTSYVQIRGERVQGTHGRRSRGRTSPTRPSAWRVYSGLAKAGCVYVHATARELPLRFVLALHALIAQSD